MSLHAVYIPYIPSAHDALRDSLLSECPELISTGHATTCKDEQEGQGEPRRGRHGTRRRQGASSEQRRFKEDDPTESDTHAKSMSKHRLRGESIGIR